MGLCGPREYITFYASFFGFGFLIAMLVLILYLFFDRMFGWEKVPCKCVSGGYQYWYKGVWYASKNISVSSEIPFEKDSELSEKASCFVKKTAPRRSRLYNSFERWGNPFGMLIGAPILPAVFYVFLPYCFRDKHQQMLVLISGGIAVGWSFICAARRASLSQVLSSEP